MKKNKENIVNWDFQCWPVYKKNIRDILQGFGLELKDGIWQIEDSNPLLDLYPKRLTDDGMGYGVDEEWITEVHTSLPTQTIKEPIANIFTEKECENIDLWREGAFIPYSTVRDLDDIVELIPIDIRRTDNGLEYLCQNEKKETEWINEQKLTYF